MKYSYKIRQNIYRDAWNWWNASNYSSHGVVWKNQINKNLADKLMNVTNKEANKILVPFLKQIYIDHKKEIKNGRDFFNQEFEQKFQDGCNKIVDVMGKPIYRNDFTIYLTTLRRGPYYKPFGLVWICIYWSDPIESFLHELCHFQFIHYWRENPKSGVSKLSNEQFEFLKESLTMILDEAFMPLIGKPDQGYELHKDFRKELTEFWNKNKNFDKLVDFGTKNVSKYI